MTNNHESETWVPIPQYEGKYEASSMGKIRSVSRIIIDKNGKPHPVKGRIRKTPLCDGYPQISLGGDKKTVTKVHRLVAAAFIGPRPAGMEVRHLNGDPTDNRVENLQYGTPSENSYDTVKHGNSHTANKTHCPKGHPYSPENTQVYAGRRNCRTCRIDYKRAYNERKRIERIALGGEIANKEQSK